MSNSEGPEYIAGNKCLVTFISQDSPRGAKETERKRSEKTKQKIEDPSFLQALGTDEVDLDVYVFAQYVSKANLAGIVQPVFKFLRNHKHDEIDAYIAQLKDEGNQYGSFVFVITSYLPRYSLSTKLEFELYDRDMTLDYFIDKMKSFESMARKPKIFLVQADNRALLVEETFPKGPGREDDKKPKIPTDADRLIIFSTIPQRLSTRPKDSTTDAGGVVSVPPSDENSHASFLMQAFVKVLEEKPDQDLLLLTPSILCCVKEMIEKFKATHSNYKDRNIEWPLVISTLRKGVFLTKLVQQQ